MLRRTRELAESAREAAAVELLTWPSIEAAIRAAAAAGGMRAVIAPAKPVEIKSTKAAGEMIERLDQLGFKTHWLSRRAATAEPEIHDLEITW